MNETNVVPVRKSGLVARMGERYGVDADKMLATLKATAFKQANNAPEVSNEQMLALLVVADQYGLNPFTREIFAFPDKGGIVPVVGVDGWARIVNSHPMFDGVSFDFDGESVTCTMRRKDLSHPVQVTEYMGECKRSTSPWGTHPRRMLRHKAYIQCARLAFGFAGIHDEDEAARILERDITPSESVAGIEAARSHLKRPAPALTDNVDKSTGEILNVPEAVPVQAEPSA